MLRELSLFSGAGGGVIGSKLLGWQTLGYVEWNEYCQKVIRQRIQDGIFDEAPIFSDVRTFASEGYARRYRGMVDVVTAGFPCQPFSVAGKQRGGSDERNMWPATVNVLRQVRPSYAVLENVTGLLTNEYIRRIFASLAKLGMDAKWCVLGGNSVGSISEGKRLWIVAFKTNSKRLESMDFQEVQFIPSRESFARQHRRTISNAISEDDYTRVKRNPDDVARGMDRLKAIGNGQMAPVFARAWETLT